MKHTILIFFVLSIIFTSGAKAQNDSSITYDNASYSCFIIKLDTSKFGNFHIIQNASSSNHKDFIEEFIANHDSSFYAINACVNDKDNKPIGLLISENKELHQINYDDGVGNFFLKPNGVFCISKSGVEIIPSTSFHRPDDVNIAIQSGPMLIINDTIHPSFNANSTNKNLRCGVGIVKNKKISYLIFSISNNPVTFHQFAKMLKEYFHCQNALCLESANSAIYSPKINNNLAVNKVVGNYIVYNINDASNAVKNGKKSTIQMIKSPSGIYQLPVELNGVLKINFILDPGASDVSISPDIALTLIKTGTVSDRDFVGTQKYVFADGSTAVSNVFMLHEIRIGNHIARNVRVSIANSISAPMLLGQSFMQRIGKFTVDNTNHTLTIE